MPNIVSCQARAIFRLRHGIFTLGSVRAAYFRALGMQVGANTKLPRILCTWPHQVRLGDSCTVEPGVYFHFDGIYRPGPSIVIGNSCYLGTGCEFNVRDRVTLGDNCLIAAGVRLIDHDHDLTGSGSSLAQEGPHSPIVLHDHVWIGANAVVLKGVVIGEGAVVAAGAVVAKPVPTNEIWAGVPARKIGVRQSGANP